MVIEASVVVPVRNGEKVLPRCLKALADQSLSRDRYEILVVDDGSTDQTGQVVRDFGVRLISQPPRGPSVARNRGVEEAQAPLVLFTDADCAPARDWIERMLDPFQDPAVAGVKGTYTSGQKSLTARFVQREYESKYERMAAFPVIDFIDTYSAGFRRDAFLSAGGYDSAYETASVEDQEFSFRLHERGARMLFQPEAKVDHFHVDRWMGYLRKKFKIGYYKALLLIQHPGRIKGDSHTPRSLQLQILLLYGMAVLLAGSVCFPLLLKGAVLLLAAFLVSTGPMLAGLIRKKDYAVLAVAPFLIALRSLGLGWGLIRGAVDFGLLRRGQPLQQPSGTDI